jgi:UDP-glucose 4-epimerase
VYGSRQNIADPYRNVVGIFMRRALSGQSFPVFGDGHQTRSFSEVRRVAAALSEAPLVPAAANGLFNIGSDTRTSILELAETIASVMKVPLQVERLPVRPEVQHAHASHERLERAFAGRLPEDVRLLDGITEMAAHVRAAPIPPPTPCPAPIEILDRLPPSWRT